ncbi:hypothetical protein ACS0TY_008715 [Phlomoides rotata]
MAKVSPASAITILAIPVLAAVLLYQLETFDPAPFPEHELTQKGPPLFVPNKNSRLLLGSEKIGYGELPGPEWCEDGWIRRVILSDSAADSVVEKWVNTGGRPLGLAHGLHGEVIVADAVKGLLNISKDGVVELLSDEADGLKFKFTDAVDIDGDGVVYFTDASYKYNMHEGLLDLLEGRPYGRLLRYDPSTKQTQVLLKDLYIANGVAVSADHTFVIVCETPMRRCNKYYIQGPRKGSTDVFVENLPGLPDNIRYDGQGLYWIALFPDSYSWKLLKRYPFIRKVIVMMANYVKPRFNDKDGGVIAVDLEGNPTAQYYDVDASMITSGIKIGEHLYLGSLAVSYITRLNVTQYHASPAL